MARDGSGTHTLPVAAYVDGTTIEADDMNTNLSDISAALTQSMSKDGQTTPTANQPMATFKHTGVGAATARTDYARADQIYGSMEYALAGGTADAITLAPSPGVSAYAIGQSFRGKAASTNTGAVTAAVNGLTAGAVTWPDGTALVAGDIVSGMMFELFVQAVTPVFHLQVGRSPSAIPKNLIDAAGDLIVGTADNTPGRLAKGTALQKLRVNSGATALEWASDPAGPVSTRRAIADVNSTVTNADGLIVYTSLSAARTVTLPAASTFTAGQSLTVIDASGSASQTVSLSLVPDGTDTIAGSNTTQVCINFARGICELVSNGTNGWDVLEWSVVYTHTLGADVDLDNTSNYFTGPTVAQGTVGTWEVVAGTVSFRDTAVENASFFIKLWDGTTVISSAKEQSPNNEGASATLLGRITAPADNIRISVRDSSATSGKIVFNGSGNSKDSSITVKRIA